MLLVPELLVLIIVPLVPLNAPDPNPNELVDVEFIKINPLYCIEILLELVPLYVKEKGRVVVIVSSSAPDVKLGVPLVNGV